MELGDDKAPFDPDNMADLQIRVVGLINNAYTNLFDQSIGGTYRKIWLEWFRACGENIKCQPEKEIFQHYKGMYKSLCVTVYFRGQGLSTGAYRYKGMIVEKLWGTGRLRVSDTQGQWFGSSLWVRATGPCKNESMGLVSLIIADTFISWSWCMIWFWWVDRPALNKWVQGPRGWDLHSSNGTIKWWSVQISGRMNCEWWQMGFSGDDKGKFLSAQFGIVIHQISLKMAWSIEMQIKT